MTVKLSCQGGHPLATHPRGADACRGVANDYIGSASEPLVHTLDDRVPYVDLPLIEPDLVSSSADILGQLYRRCAISAAVANEHVRQSSPPAASRYCVPKA
jgi:hypothetical protein